jgi:plastocyanin
MHPHRRIAAIAAVAVALSLSVAACGSSDSGGGASATTKAPSADATTTTKAPSKAAPVATDKVDIQDFAFGPEAITVKAGTTVTWTNSDTAVHTATSTAGAPTPFDTGEIAPGKTATVTFDKAGTYSYHCDIHNYMTGTVVVTA